MSPRVIFRVERAGYGPFTHPDYTVGAGLDSMIRIPDPQSDFPDGTFHAGMLCGFLDMAQFKKGVSPRDMRSLILSRYSLVRVAVVSFGVMGSEHQAIYYPDAVVNKERFSWRNVIGDHRTL